VKKMPSLLVGEAAQALGLRGFGATAFNTIGGSVTTTLMRNATASSRPAAISPAPMRACCSTRLRKRAHMRVAVVQLACVACNRGLLHEKHSQRFRQQNAKPGTFVPRARQWAFGLIHPMSKDREPL
jgi:hypothetical protein